MAKSSDTIPIRYGRSFAQVIAEKRSQDLGLCDMQLNELLKSLQGAGMEFLASPSFELTEKEKVLTSLFEQMNVVPEVKNFLFLIVKLGHIRLLPEILEAFHAESSGLQNQTEAYIRTAFPLANQEESRLISHLQKISGKTVLLKVEQDASLIGGIQVEMDGVLYDSSILGYLNRLEESLV